MEGGWASGHSGMLALPVSSSDCGGCGGLLRVVSAVCRHCVVRLSDGTVPCAVMRVLALMKAVTNGDQTAPSTRAASPPSATTRRLHGGSVN